MIQRLGTLGDVEALSIRGIVKGGSGAARYARSGVLIDGIRGDRGLVNECWSFKHLFI